MGQAKHTKGPWQIIYGGLSEADQGFGIGSKIEPRIVAECWPPGADLERRRQMLADARLIAAAPALLAACKGLIEADMSGDDGKRSAARVAFVAAIRAAEGE